jgi:hypothetical protein
MSIVSVHEPPSSWDTSVSHEDLRDQSVHPSITSGETYHNLVNRLWVLRQVIPEMCGIIITSQMSSRISLLGVDKVWELCRISHCSSSVITQYGRDRRYLQKKTGVLLQTISQFPSSVLSLTEKPLGSLCRSGDPLSPPTVENRAVTGDFLPFWNSLAMQRSDKSSVHSKYP